MHPLLTFAGGLIAGIIGIRVLNKAAAPAAARLDGLGGKARQGLDQAGESLRGAAVTGLSAIEKSSAGLRAKLAAVEPAGTAASEPAAKPAAKTARPRKAAAPKAKTAEPAAGGATP